MSTLIKDETSYKHIWSVSYPLILGGVAQTILNITDSVFLGRISEAALGASAIAGLFYVSFMMILYGFSVGTQIIVAKLEGEKKYTETGIVIDDAFIFIGIVSLILLLFLLLPGPLLISYLVNSEEVRQLSVEFLQYRAPGILFTGLFLVSRAFFTGIAQTKVVFYSTGILAVCNVILNYILVFGHFGFRAMGVGGSGLASTLSEAIACLFSLLYIGVKTDRSRYPVFRFIKIEKDRIKEILLISAPVMLQFFISVVSWFIFFVIVEKMGERALAVSNLIRNTYIILMVPLMGFSSATNTLVSNLMGQQRKRDVPVMIRRISVLSFWATLSLLLVVLIKPSVMFGIFTNEISLIEDTYPVFYVICGSLMLFSVSSILLSSVSGVGQTLMSLGIESFAIVTYLLGCYWLSGQKGLSISWVWCVEYIYFFGISILSYYFLKRNGYLNAGNLQNA